MSQRGTAAASTCRRESLLMLRWHPHRRRCAAATLDCLGCGHLRHPRHGMDRAATCGTLASGSCGHWKPRGHGLQVLRLPAPSPRFRAATASGTLVVATGLRVVRQLAPSWALARAVTESLVATGSCGHCQCHRDDDCTPVRFDQANRRCTQAAEYYSSS